MQRELQQQWRHLPTAKATRPLATRRNPQSRHAQNDATAYPLGTNMVSFVHRITGREFTTATSSGNLYPVLLPKLSLLTRGGNFLANGGSRIISCLCFATFNWQRDPLRGGISLAQGLKQRARDPNHQATGATPTFSHVKLKDKKKLGVINEGTRRRKDQHLFQDIKRSEIFTTEQWRR
ncbi:hypothetical protein TNCV_2031221 [Trichonephila clavipes]|nr:hypothetical protein TNCV_2031221 [Trichonephila clavipes]